MVHNCYSAQPPLYVEVSSLLTRHLTGIGRFVARLLDSLVPLTPLRLVTTIDRDTARSLNLSRSLLVGQEIAIDHDAPRSVDDDLTAWVRKLLRRPQRRHDPLRARDSVGLYTMLRPAERHFGRELGILYDFTPFLLPWTHQKETCESFGAFFSISSRQFDRMIAISHSTRADARWLCAVPQEHIQVGYPGPSMCVHRHADPHPAERKPNTILVVSTREPRKNGQFLMDWFFDTRVLPPGTKLLWAGSAGWLCGLGRRSGLAGKDRSVEFLDMVSDARLCRLYREVAFSIYPSLYEGFGFPVLDSLRHGTPVLCGFHSSLQEFRGLGADFFDPCDPASLDVACQGLFDKISGHRLQLAAPPLLDDKFSWDRLARDILSLSA